MKKPLSYQNSEDDSLTTTILNALKYVSTNGEVPIEILSATNELTLNKNDIKLNDYLSWLNDFNKTHDLNVNFALVPNSELNEEFVRKEISEGGVFIAKCHENHYVLITGVDEVNTYLFDPYYLDIDFNKNDEEYKIICDEESKYNRIVHNSRFFLDKEKSYSLSNPTECILVKRIL